MWWIIGVLLLGCSIVVDDVDGDDTTSCNEPQDGDEVFDDNASDVSHGSKGSRGSISREESESRLQQIKVMPPPASYPPYPPYPPYPHFSNNINIINQIRFHQLIAPNLNRFYLNAGQLGSMSIINISNAHWNYLTATFVPNANRFDKSWSILYQFCLHL